MPACWLRYFCPLHNGQVGVFLMLVCCASLVTAQGNNCFEKAAAQVLLLSSEFVNETGICPGNSTTYTLPTTGAALWTNSIYIFSDYARNPLPMVHVNNGKTVTVKNISITYRDAVVVVDALKKQNAFVNINAEAGDISAVSVTFDNVTFVSLNIPDVLSSIVAINADTVASVTVSFTRCRLTLDLRDGLVFISSTLYTTDVTVACRQTVLSLTVSKAMLLTVELRNRKAYVNHTVIHIDSSNLTYYSPMVNHVSTLRAIYIACWSLNMFQLQVINTVVVGKLNITPTFTALSVTTHFLLLDSRRFSHLHIGFYDVDVTLQSTARAAVVESERNSDNAGENVTFQFTSTNVSIIARGAEVQLASRSARALFWTTSSENLTVSCARVLIVAFVESSSKDSADSSVVLINNVSGTSSLTFVDVVVVADIRNGTFPTESNGIFAIGTLRASILETSSTNGLFRSAVVSFDHCRVDAYYSAAVASSLVGGLRTVTAVFLNRKSFRDVAVTASFCEVRIISSGAFLSSDKGAFTCSSGVHGTNTTGIVLSQSDMLQPELYRSCCALDQPSPYLASLACGVATALSNDPKTNPITSHNVSIAIRTCRIDNPFAFQRRSDLNAFVWLHDHSWNTTVVVAAITSLTEERANFDPSVSVTVISCAGCNATNTNMLVHGLSNLHCLIHFSVLESYFDSVTIVVEGGTFSAPLHVESTAPWWNVHLIQSQNGNVGLFFLHASLLLLLNTSIIAPAIGTPISNVSWDRSSMVETEHSFWIDCPLTATTLASLVGGNSQMMSTNAIIEASCEQTFTGTPSSSAATNALVMVGSVAALASLVSSSGMSIRRLTLAPSCGGRTSALESQVDATNDPLRMRFGPAAGAAHRGAVVGNIVFVLAAALCALVAMRVLHRVKRGAVCMSGCAALLQLPGALMIAVGLLYQQIMASSVLLLWSAAQSEVDGVGAADAVVGACGSALCAGVLAALVRVLLLRFEARGLPAAAVPYAARWQAVLAYWVADRVQWPPRRSGGGKRQSADGGARWFVGCYGRLFRGCCARREWWLAGDVCVTMVLSVVSGFVPTTAAGCMAEEWVFVVVTGAWLVATLVLRPKHRRLVLVKDVVSNGGQFVLAMCRALLADSNSAVLQRILLVSTVVCFVLSVVVFVGNLILSRRDVSHSRDDALWCRAADADENSNEEAGKALGLLIMAVCDAQRRSRRST